EVIPLTIHVRPVERMRPLLLLDGRPSRREPELRAFIAVLLHKGQELTTGNRASGDQEVLEEMPVARRFIVVRESVAGMADPVKPFLEKDPVQRRSSALRKRVAGDGVRRPKRVDREHVLDVGQEKFLVLLFVM